MDHANAAGAGSQHPHTVTEDLQISSDNEAHSCQSMEHQCTWCHNIKLSDPFSQIPVECWQSMALVRSQLDHEGFQHPFPRSRMAISDKVQKNACKKMYDVCIMPEGPFGRHDGW